MRKTLVNLSRLFVMAVFLGALLGAPQSAVAQLYANTVVIDVGKPQVSVVQGMGLLVFELYDANTGSTCLVNVYIQAGMSDIIKAQRITEAIQRVIKGCSCPFAVVWVNHSTVIQVINKNPNRTIWGVHVKPPDTTVEGDMLMALPPKQGTWAWNYTMWIYPNGMVPPAGTVLTMTATEPGGTVFSTTITADGVMNTAKCQTLAIKQLAAQGLVFTEVLNTLTGTHGYQTQWFPGTTMSGNGTIQWNAAWATYMGTFGVLVGPQ